MTRHVIRIALVACALLAAADPAAAGAAATDACPPEAPARRRWHRARPSRRVRGATRRERDPLLDGPYSPSSRAMIRMIGTSSPWRVSG
jgi:hypothetical protein